MSGVEFSEVMSGRLTIGATDPADGYTDPGAIPACLRAVVRIPDIDEFLRNPEHAGRLLGVLESPRLGARLGPAVTVAETTDLECSRGRFALFAPSPPPAQPDQRLMVYDAAVDIDGDGYWMRGRKFVSPAPVWHGWRATTTLHVTVHRGLDDRAPVVAAGILRLDTRGLLALLRSMQATGCAHWYQRVRARLQFMTFFGRSLGRTYLLGRPL